VTEPAAYSDDLENIPNSDELLRRIHPTWVVPDELLGSRLTSQAFEDTRKPQKSPCSVSVRRLAPPLDALMAKYPDRSFAGLSAEFARSQQQGICLWPAEGEPGHAYLHGPKSSAIKNALAKQAKYLGGPRAWPIEGDAPQAQPPLVASHELHAPQVQQTTPPTPPGSDLP